MFVFVLKDFGPGIRRVIVDWLCHTALPETFEFDHSLL